MSSRAVADWPYRRFANNDSPTEADLALTTRLDGWISENAEIEDLPERQKKERILCEITATVRKWVTISKAYA